jgi:hypothetical protein
MSEGLGRIRRQRHLRSALFPYKALFMQYRNFTHAQIHTGREMHSHRRAGPPSVHEIIYIYGFRFGCIMISFLKDAKYAHENTMLSVCPMLRLILTKLGMDVTQRMCPLHHCNLRHICQIFNTIWYERYTYSDQSKIALPTSVTTTHETHQ